MDSPQTLWEGCYFFFYFLRRLYNVFDLNSLPFPHPPNSGCFCFKLVKTNLLPSIGMWGLTRARPPPTQHPTAANEVGCQVPLPLPQLGFWSVLGLHRSCGCRQDRYEFRTRSCPDVSKRPSFPRSQAPLLARTLTAPLSQ